MFQNSMKIGRKENPRTEVVLLERSIYISCWMLNTASDVTGSKYTQKEETSKPILGFTTRLSLVVKGGN